MNKGFAHYFGKALKTALQTICKNKNILQSMLYFFTSLVARLTILLGAMPALADVRQAKIAKNEHTMDIPQSFTNASRKPFWTMTVATLLEVFIFLGGLLLVSVPCGVIFAIGSALGQAVGSSGNVITTIFAVPCLIIYLVYTIIVVTIFSPTAYVVDSNPALSAGEVVSVCVNSMKSRGKITAFMCVFVPMLIIVAIAGAFGAGFYVITTLMKGSNFMLLVLILLAAVAVVVLGFAAPIFTLTMNISLVSLFEDIALDPVNASKRTAGINIKKISGAKVDREEVADNLNALFDSAIEEKRPEEEVLAHRHKKKERKYAETEEEAEALENGEPSPQGDATFEEVDDYADELPAPEPVHTSEPNQVPERHSSMPEQAQPMSQPTAAQHTPNQPAAEQPHPGQPIPSQPAAEQSHPGQPMPSQPAAEQPRPGQPMPSQPAAEQPHPGQPMPGQPMAGQPRPGQPMPGQPPVPPYPPQGNGANGNG